MGVRVAYDPVEPVACLYDSVSGFAFGPTFREPEDAEDFLEYARRREGVDVRRIPDARLRTLYGDWFDNRRQAQGEKQDEMKARDF